MGWLNRRIAELDGRLRGLDRDCTKRCGDSEGFSGGDLAGFSAEGRHLPHPHSPLLSLALPPGVDDLQQIRQVDNPIAVDVGRARREVFEYVRGA